jgi:hypothetical protein
MFLLEGKPLAPGRPFVTSDGTQYPANWLRLASKKQKEAIGITEAPDPRPYDQRFYWGYSETGKLIEKDLDQLKTQWISTVKQTANSMLSQTDWMVIRSSDPSSNKILSEEVKQERSTIRLKSDEKEEKIDQFTTVGELAAFVTSTEYHSWSEPEEVVDEVTASGVFTGTTLFSGSSEDTITFG